MWATSLLTRQPDCPPPHLVTRPNHFQGGRCQFGAGHLSLWCLLSVSYFQLKQQKKETAGKVRQ